MRYLPFFMYMLCFKVTMHAQNPWTLLKSENGINIYWRSVPQSAFNEIKATFQIHANIKLALSLLTDIPNQKKMVYACDSSAVIKNIDTYTRIIYHRFKMPWPVSDRDDYCIQKLSKINANTYQIETKNISGSAYPSTACVRIPHEHSIIQVSATDANHTQVEYALKTEPGGYLPAWAVNAMMDIGPYNTICNIRKNITHYNKISNAVNTLIP
jgi:hypothetical protein